MIWDIDGGSRVAADQSRSLPTRLNLGCGYDIRPDYLNVDMQEFHHPDLVADITSLPMLPSGHFQEILAQDVLEHLERGKARPALKEWARLLREEGVLTIRVPSLLHVMDMLTRPENQSAEDAERIIHLLYGTQAYEGDYHLNGFTARTIESSLAQAGLLVCNAWVRDQWLYVVQARKTGELREPTEFVHNAFFRILGRHADPSGLAHYTAALDSGGLSRPALEQELAFHARDPAEQNWRSVCWSAPEG